MLQAIRNFFDANMTASPPGARPGHTIELATAALLVEVSRIDSETTAQEREAVERAIRDRFGLNADEAAELIRLADAEVKQATDYFQFTSLVNRHFSAQQKQDVLELMWRIAYADAELSAHENHLMRRIADLLHVPHGDYIAAKMRAREAAGV